MRDYSDIHTPPDEEAEPEGGRESPGVPAFSDEALALGFANRHEHRLRYVATPLLLVALGLCAAVLVVAPEINGAKRWFILGPASFQVSPASWGSAR